MGLETLFDTCKTYSFGVFDGARPVSSLLPVFGLFTEHTRNIHDEITAVSKNVFSNSFLSLINR